MGVCLAATTAMAEVPKMKMTTDIPPEITTPDVVDTSIGTLNFFDGVPTKETIDTVYDYMDRARAVQAYVSTVPGVSQYAMRQGQRDIGATKVNQILIWDKLADSKSLFLTGNSSTIYTWTYTDLANDGPTVIELPPGMLGVVDDMWFRYVTDLGIAGPDQGKGGKYLILPPGYDGEVPDGYFVVRPATYGNWIFMRAYISDGVDKAAQGVRDNLKIYPLSMADNPPEPEFIGMSGRGDYNAVLPNDYSYWEMLNQLVQEEPIGAHDPETRGLLAALGIAKGEPFAPDARMKAILTDAVAIGNAYARANTVCPERQRPADLWARQRVGHGLCQQGLDLPGRWRTPVRFPAVDALQRRGCDARDGRHRARQGVGLRHRGIGEGRRDPRRWQDLQADPAAECSGQGFLVSHGL